MSNITVLPLRAEPHIPHGSGDAEWQMIDVASGHAIAIVDPEMILPDPEAVAFGIALASQAYAHLIASLGDIASDGPLKAPQAESYHDTESAYGNGQDIAAWKAAEKARRALALIARLTANREPEGATSPPPAAFAALFAACDDASEYVERFGEVTEAPRDSNCWTALDAMRAARTMAAPYMPGRSNTPTGKAKAALAHLVAARELLKSAGCSPRMIERVRAAISSAKGAVRHAEHRTVEG